MRKLIIESIPGEPRRIADNLSLKILALPDSVCISSQGTLRRGYLKSYAMILLARRPEL